MQLFRLSNFLNSYLINENFSDYSLNGLQIQNNGQINKIYTAVDSNIYSINACSENSLLIVHHGLFWGKSFPITGANYKKINTLISKNIALYASHLPLDAHNEIGNNALLIKGLNAEITGEFGRYKSNSIGFTGELKKESTINKISTELALLIGRKPEVFSFSENRKINTICAVSGDPGLDILEEFAKSKIDLLVTGESSHILYNFAEDNELNIICGGHYATEALGVKALGKRVASEFLLENEFIEHPTGL